ncbi:SufD family Fe-S cluster assembly protein [Kosmotoga pacifica]|uniref:SUF system FeS cluster assembly SufBD core domain-containing protein n=1 Tax=Kosmotoga pacifica TaxID=1330330 RepID=A0A0G2ZC13_9BACT|nr:SufD family Fe-S cluster assembly protein [Kosmotoga pacifica]AKI97099.1 hypothetical protein IX53_03870 [Kosmotoga pacifica]
MNMEKTLNLIHNEFKMLEPLPAILDIKDYSEDDFLPALDRCSEACDSFKRRAYEEYKTLKFPKWKRAPLEDLQLVKPIPNSKYIIEGPEIIRPMSEIKNFEKELLLNLDFQGSDRKFTLLADAFSREGVIIYTEKETNYTEPIFLNAMSEGFLASNLIVVGESSRLSIVFYGQNEGTFRAITNRFLLRKNAQLNVLFVNFASNNAYQFFNNYYLLDENARLQLYDINLGGEVTAPYHLVKAAAQGAKAVVKPLFFPANHEKIDMLYLGRITASEATVEIEGIGAVSGYSKAIFRGFIDIKKGAKNANGTEHSSTVMLSDTAIVQSIPSLFVDENEVNASHAASVGTVESEKIYYLMTRGLSKNEALKLVVTGAFDPVIEEIGRIFGEGAVGGVRDVIGERIG